MPKSTAAPARTRTTTTRRATSAPGPVSAAEVAPVEAPPATVARPTRRRTRQPRPVAPVALGSLTQPGARGDDSCARCGSTRVTSLSMTLTDGTPVRFSSCHTCEHRSWQAPGGELDRDTVLERTRKVR